MTSVHRSVLVGIGVLAAAGPAAAAPAVEEQGSQVVVTGERYRAMIGREMAGLTLELRGDDGEWHSIGDGQRAFTLGHYHEGEHTAGDLRTTWTLEKSDTGVLIGQQIVLSQAPSVTLDLHTFCTGAGLLLGARLLGEGAGRGTLWSPPRIALRPADWQGYLFWDPEGKAREGRVAALDPCPAYAGVSAWGQEGDTAKGLDPRHPALVARSQWGTDLGVVLVDYQARWAGSSTFLQRHTPAHLYLYSGHVPAERAAKPLWAWLAALPRGDAAATAARVAELAREGERLAAGFRPISRAVPVEWTKPLPDFPAGLKRPRPVEDINQAVVYTINETTRSAAALDLARKAGSDVLIRGWFKWSQAPPVDRMRELPERARAFGALFGGGITCSALYDQENGITREQLLDMATRGPDGELVDAWDTAGIRHGSLSCPAYLDYLFRWCREQIDAGVDILFMDEHTAALSQMEGYDDHSLRDFRRYLLEACPQTREWRADDPRWRSDWQIDLADPKLCPDGTVASFDYRAYLRAKDLFQRPNGPGNPLAMLWHQFRAYRDDRAWKGLTDRIRAYAREKGRRVLIDANGIAPYVDLQVLGVWGQWTTKNNRIDLSESQLPYWRSLVRRGHVVAGKRVPVVLFHDWGFGETPFPWMAVPPSDRDVWMRTRGAEIYAAGGFFAFPVIGPFGCDSSRDGTFATIARQTAFYQRHRDLYLRGRYLGSEPLQTETPGLSLAAWWSDQPSALALHVINRDFRDGQLHPRKEVAVTIPVEALPERVSLLSPDWEGERMGVWGYGSMGVWETGRPSTPPHPHTPTPPHALRGPGGAKSVTITIPEVDAYVVALLHYAAAPDISRVKDPARVALAARWERPDRSEFPVRPGGVVEGADSLNGFLQGTLHTHLRNPPTFLVNARAGAKLLVKVRAVATAGARIEYRVDGETRKAVDLPDKDGKNDGALPEYDQVIAFDIPAGKHRVTLDNVGGDWAVLTWLEFQGEFGAP